MKTTKEEVQSLAIKKRAELETALEQNVIAEPVSTLIISALVSAAISGAAGPLTRARGKLDER